MAGAGYLLFNDSESDMLQQFRLETLIGQAAANRGSGEIRSSLTEQGLAIAGQYLLLGAGPGQAEVIVGSGAGALAITNLHNWWLETYADGGLPGFALHFLFFVALFLTLWPIARTDPDPLLRYFAGGTALALIGFTVGALGPSSAVSFTPMWILYGLGIAVVTRARLDARQRAAADIMALAGPHRRGRFMRLDQFLKRAETTVPVLVFQVSLANGLGIIRDLVDFGVPSLALDHEPAAIGLRSRFAPGMVCPDPKEDEEAFLVFLEQLGRRLPQRAVLFPTHDEYIWPLSRSADRLAPWFIIPFSRWPEMRRLHDKKAQLEAAWKVGVDTPKTVFVDSRDDLERGMDEIGFPAIFKPVESLAFKVRFRRHVLEISSPDELRSTYERVTDCGTLMLQEVIPGGDEELWSLGSYLDAQSRPLALFTGHKLRQHPVRFGHVRMAVSRWDQGVADDGVRLLQELHYHGVSQVEFKRDPRDGSDRLMEINARHWMWHSLAAACGVNLSLAAYRDAIGRPYVARRQTDGRKWVVAITDVRDAQAEFRRGERDFLPWLKSYAGVVEDGVLSLRDPVPGLLATGRQVRSIVWRRRAKPAG